MRTSVLVLVVLSTLLATHGAFAHSPLTKLRKEFDFRGNATMEVTPNAIGDGADVITCKWSGIPKVRTMCDFVMGIWVLDMLLNSDWMVFAPPQQSLDGIYPSLPLLFKTTTRSFTCSPTPMILSASASSTTTLLPRPGATLLVTSMSRASRAGKLAVVKSLFACSILASTFCLITPWFIHAAHLL